MSFENKNHFQSDPEQPSYVRGMRALENRIMTSNRHVNYDPTTMRFVSQHNEGLPDAIARLVEVDVEDPLAPGMPLGYHAALFTREGSQKHGIRAQISRPVHSSDPAVEKTVVTGFLMDGRVVQDIVTSHDGIVTIGEHRELDPAEIEEFNEQLETLRKPNSERTYPSILK
jgi:hypothetical protein